MSASDLKQVATGNRPSNPIVIRQSFLEKRKDQLANGMPNHMNATRLIRSAVVAMMSNPALQECSEMSIYQSISVAANLGLDIIGGQGYLVPYKGKCTFVPGWQGLTDLVSRTGRAAVWTGAVFEGDEFDYAKGDSPFIRHKERAEDDDWKKIQYIYAVGRVKGSDYPVIEVWTMNKVLNHLKKFNKVGTRHYAYENMEMYARKVVLLQVLKYLPKSQEMVDAIDANQAAEDGKSVTIDGDFMVIHEDEQNAVHETQHQDKAEEKQSPPMRAATAKENKPEQTGITYAQVADKISKADALDVLDVASELIKEVSDEDQRNELHDLVRSRRKELKPAKAEKGSSGMSVD